MQIDRFDEPVQMTVSLAGSGGYGDPGGRDRAAIEADLEAGIITPESARADYGYDD